MIEELPKPIIMADLIASLDNEALQIVVTFALVGNVQIYRNEFSSQKVTAEDFVRKVFSSKITEDAVVAIRKLLDEHKKDRTSLVPPPAE